MRRRHLLVGDIHGCLEELDELCAELCGEHVWEFG